MAAHHPGNPHWAVLIAGLALAASGVGALRGSRPPRTAAEKFQVASPYHDTGWEACSLCFSRIDRQQVHTYSVLYARTTSVRGAKSHHAIYVCHRCPWPLDRAAQQAALGNWRDVQIEWIRERQRLAVGFPHLLEPRIREYQGARLTIPDFLQEWELPTRRTVSEVAAMSAHRPSGKSHRALILAAVVLATVAAATLARARRPPRTAAEKLRVATTYQDVGEEPCYLCFSRIKEPQGRHRDALYARTPSQDPATGYHTIFICLAHPRPLTAAEHQGALRNWKDVQIEWWRDERPRGAFMASRVERKVRDFEEACLTTPAFLNVWDLP